MATEHNEEISTAKKIHEALAEEKKNEPKGMVHYRFFRVEKDEKTGEEKKITMKKFWAKDDAAAYEELKKYRKLANKAYTYYFGTTGNYIGNSLDKNGKVKRYDSLKEMLDEEENEKTPIARLKDKIVFNLHILIDKTKDIWYKLSDCHFLLKTKHNRNEHWSLDYHIVDDLIFNIPILMKDKCGVPVQFCIKARKELNKNKKDFDAEASFSKNPDSSDKEIELAAKMLNEELEKGLLYAKLWKFYSSYGLDCDEDFKQKWDHTIPYVPGTYDKIDYAKLASLEKRCWNSLWNWFKDNGHYIAD